MTPQLVLSVSLLVSVGHGVCASALVLTLAAHAVGLSTRLSQCMVRWSTASSNTTRPDVLPSLVT